MLVFRFVWFSRTLCVDASRAASVTLCRSRFRQAEIGTLPFVSVQGVHLVAHEITQTEEIRGTVINIGSFRDRMRAAPASQAAMWVKVEVACNEPVGEDIRKGLERELGKRGGITVVHDSPDWVFSIVAFHQGQLVELSVILRRFFRGTKPGTEIDTNLPDSALKVRPGAWTYESLRFHGLFGVRFSELDDLLVFVAEEFRTHHLAGKGRNRRSPRVDKQDDR
jgi:hypothetical protein